MRAESRWDVVDRERAIVWLVDDDKSVRRSLRLVLWSLGYRVEAFASAGEVLERPDLADVDCIVSDIRMSGGSGLELQNRLASRCPGLPVILITGHDDPAAEQQGMEAGAVAVLHKPFDDVRLQEAVLRGLRPRTSKSTGGPKSP